MKTSKKQSQHKPESYNGWKIRFVVPPEGATNKGPFWQIDNCDRNDRKRQSFKTKEAAIEHIDTETKEAENFGKTFSMDDDLRTAALKAIRTANGRATLSEIVKYWADRHPNDGAKIPLSKMVVRFMSDREKVGNRPATVRSIRQKLATFTTEIGAETAVAGIWEDDVVRFVDSRTGGDESRRAWKKVLNSFFRYCQDKQAIKTNPAAQIVLPKKAKKSPTFWPVGDVESVMRIAEREEPEMAACLAVLFFAGLRPVEVVGQYGLEDARITSAKKELAQAWTNYDAEKIRLGLDRGQGGDTQKQKQARVRLEASDQASTLLAAQIKLAEARNKFGGEAMPGLLWGDVNLDEGFIRVRAETSKVQEPRLVDIEPNLRAWLQKYRRVGGPLAPNPTEFRRARNRILAKMHKKRWEPDVARHTYATMHFAAKKNRELLAAQLGHSAGSRQIEIHYKGLATPKEAAKYWQVMPEDSALVDASASVRVRARGA